MGDSAGSRTTSTCCTARASGSCLCMALGLYVAATRRLLPFLSGLLCLSYTIFLPWNMGTYKNPAAPEAEAILKNIPRGEPVMSIAVDPRWTWPTIEKLGLLWPSHLYSYWMMATLTQVRVDGPPSPEMERLGDQVRRTTALEMRCMPPALILFEKPREYALKKVPFDFRTYFMADADLKRFLEENYREMPDSRSFYLYRRVKSPKPLVSPECPRLSRDQYFRKSG